MPGTDMPDIPDFLRLTPQQRAAAWLKTPPPVIPVQPIPESVASEVRPVVVDPVKRNKTATRISRMRQNLLLDGIPPAFREWDYRRAQWVDSRITHDKKLKAAAARLGITLENTEMDKFTLSPYLKEQPLPVSRAKTTLVATAADFQIQAKVVKVAHRAGLKKLERVEVMNPDGSLKETWTLDFESGLLQKVGTDLKIPTREQETDMPKKTKKTAAKKTNGKTKTAKAPRAPGVIATIIETIKRDRGANREEILAVLEKKFPNRKPDSMANTINIQANRNAKKKDRDEKRGLVYYG